MESVLTGVVILFLILFAVLTFAENGMAAQTSIQDAWQEMQARVDLQSRSYLQVMNAHIMDHGTVMEVTLANTGSVKLADFDDWDAIVQYLDDGEPGQYHIERLPYDSLAGSNRWRVESIFLDEPRAIVETFDPDILNPGETLVAHIAVAPPVGFGATVLATLSTPDGVTLSTQARRNVPPVLSLNEAITVGAQAVQTITSDTLLVTDVDNTPDELIFTVISPPVFGSLSPGATFTQADIDALRLSYEHWAGEPDTFDFEVSDGVDTIGPFTFQIEINDPPQLITNDRLTLNGPQQVAAIGPGVLEATDPDHDADDLVYTVTTSPTQGWLSSGTSFTQDDINAGRLTYTHTGTESDRFEFTVSDGEFVIGDYTFWIDVLS